MVLNVDKCWFMYLAKYTKNETLIFNDLIYNNSNKEKTLGITTDNKLTLM